MSEASAPPAGALPVVVSGMRPTGRLHLGHLHGALANWVRLQEEARCFFFSADWHALTTSYHDTAGLKAAEREMFVDFIAAGIDPERSTLFVQSHVKEHAELYLLLGMITPLGWLERSPSYKELRENITDRDLALYGFLGYPVLMTADIILYKAERVPVGADQVAHLELCREIARRFNHHYGEVFPEPRPVLTEAAKVVGTDGRKMSKSYGNAIDLGEEVASTTRKVMSAVTDPARKRRQDPGNPEVCGILLPPPHLQLAGDGGLGRCRVPHRRDRLRRLQAQAARNARSGAGGAARAPRGPARAPGRPRRAGEARNPPRAGGGGAHHGRGPRRDEALTLPRVAWRRSPPGRRRRSPQPAWKRGRPRPRAPRWTPSASRCRRSGPASRPSRGRSTSSSTS